jgi:hypothetical protein
VDFPRFGGQGDFVSGLLMLRTPSSLTREASPGEPVVVPYWGCDRPAGHADHIQGDPLLDCAVASLGRERMPGDYDDEAIGP